MIDTDPMARATSMIEEANRKIAAAQEQIKRNGGAPLPTRLVEDCVRMAAHASLLFAGQPWDEVVAPALQKIKEDLRIGFTHDYGAAIGTLVAESFVKAVISRRAEIENAGPMPGRAN